MYVYDNIKMKSPTKQKYFNKQNYQLFYFFSIFVSLFILFLIIVT